MFEVLSDNRDVLLVWEVYSEPSGDDFRNVAKRDRGNGDHRPCLERSL